MMRLRPLLRRFLGRFARSERGSSTIEFAITVPAMLFMLVSAFSGLPTMQAAYAHAIKSGYRFYSYGDACLLERADG